MNTGYVYALKNKSFGDHVIKIGLTKRTPDIRAKEIYSGATGVPEPFDVAFACFTADCESAEQILHKRLNAFRHNKKREFFVIPIQVAKDLILNTCQDINSRLGCPSQSLISIDNTNQNDDQMPSDDELTYEASNIMCIPPEKLLPSPIYNSILTDCDKDRILIVSMILAYVFPMALDEWFDAFSHDHHPTDEIAIWETIAKAFLKIDQVAYLDDKHKKEAYYLLLMRSWMSTSKVLKEYKRKYFSKEVAKRILRGYELPPCPITVEFASNSRFQLDREHF